MRSIAVVAIVAVLAGCAGSTTVPTGTSDATAVMPPEAPPADPGSSPIDVPMDDVAPPLVREPAPDEQVAVWSTGCDVPDCRIDLHFSLPMVRDLAAPPPPILMEPAIAGTWAWMAPTHLAFTPEPGALPHGSEVTITVDAVPVAGDAHRRPAAQVWTSVPRFALGGKVAHWPVRPGEPRFVGFLDRFSLSVGDGPILLIYDQPVDPAAIAHAVTLRTDTGRRLAARVSGATEVAHALDEPLPDGHVVAVVPKDLPSDGFVEIRVPSAGGEETWTLDIRRHFAVTEHRWLDAGWDVLDTDAIPLDARLSLTLTTPVLPSALEEAVRITPAPVAHRVSVWGNAAHITVQLDPGVDYTLTIDPSLRDALGNTMPDPFVLPFRSRDLPPELGVPRLPVAVEAGRGSVELRTRNIAGLSATVIPMDVEAFIRAMVTGGGCPVVGEGEVVPVRASPVRPNVRQERRVDLGDGVGLLCVVVSGETTGSEAIGTLEDRVLVQSTDLGLTAKVTEGEVFAWVTDLSDAAVVQDATVAIVDAAGRRRGTGRTDPDGVVRIPDAAARPWGVDEPLYAVATRGSDVVVVPLVEDRLSQPWRFGLSGATPDRDPLPAALFAERGAYRPGETAHVTLLAGPAAAGASATFTVLDPRGQQVTQTEEDLDAFGVATLDVDTPMGAPVGVWSVRAEVEGRTVTHRYRVEEFRVPTFEVRVDSGAWSLGERVESVVSAAYLHGGSLDGRRVRWEVSRAPVPFAPRRFPRFRFAMDDGSRLAGSVASGEARLDGVGTHIVAFTPEHPSSAGPMRYTLEATVTDVDRQAYAGRRSEVIHPAGFYVGLAPPIRDVLAVGDTVEVPVVAVTPSGEALAGVPVRVRLERIDHHSTTRLASNGQTQTLSRPVAVDRDSCLVTTGEAPAVCTFQVAEAGEWRVRAWARDARMRDVASGFTFRATGATTAAWPRFDRERIAVSVDKAVHAPGDVATLVVQTPFPRATGLLTLERDGVMSHRVFTIDRDTPAIEVPITAEHAPNVFATVSLIRGREHDLVDATGFPTGAPAFRLGTVELVVERSERRLAVGVTPSTDAAIPGQRIEVDVTLADAAGRPVTGQATVMVVDEAVLGLTGYRPPDPVAALYPDRPLGVRTADSRLELPHARRARREALFPGGDGGEGGGFQPMNLLRTLFESTAFFDARVPVTDGVGHVAFDLPDNTTTYRVMVVGVDARGRAGSGASAVVVSRPLMVQAVTPRFVYPGDTLVVEALVHNGTDSDAEVSVTSRMGGLEGMGPTGGSVSVLAHGTARLPLRVRVTGGDEATLALSATTDAFADAVEVTLPIREAGTSRRQVVETSVLDREELAVAFPDDVVPGTERLEVVASTTSLTALKGAVDYLMGYPNGCIEQTTSRAYPLVVLGDLLPEIGVDVDRAQLQEFSEAGIRRILSFQTPAGGLSYWPGGDTPHAFATAFGLTALIEAKKRGYDVPDADLQRMGDYLVETLSQGTIHEEMPHGDMADGDTRALFVMTLGRLGRPQPSWVERLWADKDKLTPYGLSFLGVAAAELDTDHPLVEPILAEIARRAEEDDDEVWFEGERGRGYSMGSPLRSHAAALIATSRARDPLAGKVLEGLLRRRRNGLWGNTQENVFGIMGVHALATTGPGDAGAPTLALTHNGRPIDVGGMEVVSSRVRRQRVGPSDLGTREHTVTATNLGGPPIHLTVRAEYDVELTAENRRPTSQGAAIARTYTTLDGEPLTGEIPLGSLVLVTVQIETDAPYNYVAVDDKLPAGLEPLNTELATTERVDLGELTPALSGGLSVLSYREIRDHRVAFYADALPAGTWAWRYVARATTPGTFLRPAGRVEAMYDPEVFASTAIDTVTVR